MRLIQYCSNETNRSGRCMNMKKLFEHSIWKLLEKTGIENITLKMLIEDVGSCKGTFYKYYLDKFDLCNSCFDSAVYNRIDGDCAFGAFCEECFVLFKTHINVVRHAFDSADVNSATAHFESKIVERVSGLPALRDSFGSDGLCAACVSVFARSCGRIVAEWLSGGCEESIERMCEKVRALTPQYVYGAIYGSAAERAL